MIGDQMRLRAIHHIVHDYAILISAGTEMTRCPKPPLNSHVQYSFILQYRKFADFFSNVRRNTTHRKGDIDIIAADFAGRKIRFKLPEWNKWARHLNAHLFHLNYLRTRNTRPWMGYTENPKMLEEIRSAWKLFLEKMPELYLGRFNEEIAKKLLPGSEFTDLDLL
jgi:hypothetical protein